MAGPSVKVHPGKRKGNPMLTRNGKPRLGPLNVKQLTALLDKTQANKTKAKIVREIAKKNLRLIKKNHPEILKS
jgi:hypothetical protein